MFYPTKVPYVSVVIPTYKHIGLSLVERCLRSLASTHQHMLGHMEIIVVEDSLEEDIRDYVMKVANRNNLKLDFYNQQNGGFASACNLGLQNCSGQIVFLVNNDIEFTDCSLQILADAIVTTKAGVIGTRLLYPDYTIQHAGVTFVPSPHATGPGYFDHVLRNQYCNHMSAIQMRPSLVTGALFGMKRSTIDIVGLLDEKFEFSCEDVDYCLRTIESGMDVLYCGYTKAIHSEGATRGKTLEEKQRVAPDVAEKESRSMAYLFDKWNGIDWSNFTQDGA